MNQMLEIEKLNFPEAIMVNTWAIINKLVEWYETENNEALFQVGAARGEEDDIVLCWPSSGTYCEIDTTEVHIHQKNKSKTYQFDSEEKISFFIDLKSYLL